MTQRTRQVSAIVGALALGIVLMVPAFAQQGQWQRPDVGPKGAIGRISAISSSSITVDTRDAGSKTFTISPTTTLSLDKQTVTVDKLTNGLFAAVTSTDGAAATDIAARTRHRRPAAPPAQTPSPEPATTPGH